MTGHHEVRVFKFSRSSRSLTLPSDWKPFAVARFDGGFDVVCRKWVRDETKEKAEKPST